jgi:hypothetical protein
MSEREPGIEIPANVQQSRIRQSAHAVKLIEKVHQKTAEFEVDYADLLRGFATMIEYLLGGQETPNTSAQDAIQSAIIQTLPTIRSKADKYEVLVVLTKNLHQDAKTALRILLKEEEKNHHEGSQICTECQSIQDRGVGVCKCGDNTAAHTQLTDHQYEEMYDEDCDGQHEDGRHLCKSHRNDPNVVS